MIPSIPTFLNSIPVSTASPNPGLSTPAITGTLPAVSSATISTNLILSEGERLVNSPVPPRGTKPATPDSIRKATNLRVPSLFILSIQLDLSFHHACAMMQSDQFLTGCQDPSEQRPGKEKRPLSRGLA